MKKLFGMLLAILIIIHFAPIQTQADNVSYYTIVPEVGVSMTATADVQGMTVAKLKQGARVGMVLQQDGWTKIDYNGRLGWVKNEFIKPFMTDVKPIYSSYYKQLHTTENLVYALVYDFTQDGVEDLYIVTDADTSKGEYVEQIFSGEELVYKKTLQDGLMIVRDATEYYIKHYSAINRDSTFALGDLNNQAKTDYYEGSGGKEDYKIQTSSYFNTIHIVKSANGGVQELTFSAEEVASKNYYGSDNVNQYNESIYANHYLLSNNGKKKSLTYKDFQQAIAPYERAKVVMDIYSDDYRSAVLTNRYAFQVERVVQQLFELAKKSPNASIVGETLVEYDQQEVAMLRQRLAQSAVLEIPLSAEEERNFLTYFKKVEQGIVTSIPYVDPELFTRTTTLENERGQKYYDRTPIDQVLYDFYGVKINDDQFKAASTIDGPQVDEAYYASAFTEPEQQQTYLYRQLQNIIKLDNDYIALQFADYEMPWDVLADEIDESVLIAGDNTGAGYVILKRLPFKKGTQWVYIDTIDTIEGISLVRYQEYANNLYAIQQLAAEQKVPEVESVEDAPIEVVQLASEPEESTGSIWPFLLAMVLSYGIYAAGYTWYRKKKSNI